MQITVLYFVDVILPLPLGRNYTYSISEAEYRFIKPGIRVVVPFGKSKYYTAIVQEKHSNPPIIYEAKPIVQILDQSPVVTSKQLSFWQWIASYYACSLGEVVKAALPSSYLLESTTLVQLSSNLILDDLQFTDDEFLVVEALKQKSPLRVEEVRQILDKKDALKPLKNLINSKVISLAHEVFDKYQPKLIRCIRLTDNFKTTSSLEDISVKLSRSPKQRAVVLAYFALQSKGNNPISVKDLKLKSQASSTQIKQLIDKLIFEEYYHQVNRINQELFAHNPNLILSAAQAKALDEIKNVFLTQSTCLLHGVTSSGKTEIYIKLIEETIAVGKQILFLVPEIALTTQLLDRLKLYFENKVVVYHSRYSQNERHEIWQLMLNDSERGQIVLGARSALMLPFKNLGLVIIDESHELSYKQFDPAPRYHARDAALVLAAKFNAKTLLGSATPSVESYYNAKTLKKFGYVNLGVRYGNVLPPEIELVDLKKAYKRKQMRGHFSHRLLSEIESALNDNLQIILFQNRRGYAPVVSCNSCGHSPNCPNCDVSLTYHRFQKQLRCHYCSYTMAMQNNCQACGSPGLDAVGFGTEQIQEEIKQFFPNARVSRMDYDTTKGKRSFETLINAFQQQEIDILVGTQMLTKGLDFRKVKLVGVLNADQLINFPDFRAQERSFQMLQQVAGRSGRTADQGKVIIQTFNPYHSIFQQVSTNDYQTMFKEQLDQRHAYKYPPFYRLIKLTLRHSDYAKVNAASEWVAKSLRAVFGEYVLGPEFPSIPRIRNKYNKNILLKIPNGQSVKKTKEVIIKIKNTFLNIGEFRTIRVVINVDSY